MNIHTITLVAVAALASCCPAKAQRPASAVQIAGPWANGHEQKYGERTMMRTCLSGRATLFAHRGHGKHGSLAVRMEHPDERLEYCIAQIENYRSIAP